MCDPGATHDGIMPRNSDDASYRKLLVWQKARCLVRATYVMVRALPEYERYDLARQLRRAATSVVANIVEGSGRRNRGEYTQFLAMARGSVREVAGLVDVVDVCDLAPKDLLEEPAKLADEVSRMLTAMLRKLGPL